MSELRRALDAHRTDDAGRQWLFVPYDQLTDAVGPLSRTAPRELGIVVVECPGKAARRPYHQQKLALVLTSLRHFAVEQAARGVAVRHVVAPSYLEALSGLRGLGPLSVMKPAERELRAELAPLFESGQLTVIPHEGWLTTTEDFELTTADRPWRMDAFYRQVRRRLGILMVQGKPLGDGWMRQVISRSDDGGTPAARSSVT
jgi:deoxyribodipyrimidine photolyase-related protein